jgi:cation:H+ antiporter
LVTNGVESYGAMLGDWLLFLFAALVIIVAGSALAVCADVVVRRTGLGALWFGAVGVAFVTSLPELVTNISAVRRDAPALALGDLFGSSMANMAILAAITIAFTTRRLLQRAALENVLTAMLAVGLTSLVVVLATAGSLPSVGSVGLGPLLVAIVFLVGTFAVKEQQETATVETESPRDLEISLSMAQAGFVIAAVVILLAGPQLAASADKLADSTGVGETFFGSFSLALVTSLPELSVSIVALRIGAQNLAIANLLGSNATNMALILPMDMAFDGNILEHADRGLLTAAAAAILLMSIGTMAIVLRSERNRLPVDLAAVLMLVVYGGGLWAIYSSS